MRQKKLYLSLLSVFVLALASLILWLTELLWVIGWDYFSWLRGASNVVFGINGLVVLAYLLPVVLIRGITWKKLWMPALELYFVTIIAFFIGKSILYSLFLPMSVFDLSPYILWLMLGMLLLTTAGSFYYLTRNQLYPVRVGFVPLFIGAGLFAVACSLLATFLLFRPATWSAVPELTVKAGLPFFFVTLFVGLFSIFSMYKLDAQQSGGQEQEEILDDLMM